MMGIVVPETCWAYKKYNKIISNIYLVLVLQLSQWCTVRHTSEEIMRLNSSMNQPFFQSQIPDSGSERDIWEEVCLQRIYILNYHHATMACRGL